MNEAIGVNVPENSSNDVREALLQLDQKVEKLSEKIEQLENRFNADSKAINGMVKIAMTTIIATASVIGVLNLVPAVVTMVTAFSAAPHS